MKFEEILKTYGKIERETAELKLYVLGNTLFSPNKWKFIPGYDSETSTSDSGKQYYVTIAENALTDGCTDSEYNKAGYVLTMKHMYHESRHVWQHTKAWNNKAGLNSIKSYKQTTDLVRREFLKKYFPSIYYNNYFNDPSEIDAVKSEIRDSLNHFEKDPLVDKSEAEDILYKFMMSEDCVYEETLKPHKDELKDIYDVLHFFNERAETYVNEKYSVTMDIDPIFKNDPDIDMSFTDRFLHDKEFKEYRTALKKCKTGIEQDKILEQAVIFAYPDVIRKAPIRLRKELLDCKNQMELGTLRPGMHAIYPKHINYSIENFSPSEEIELTENDLVTIPYDHGPVL